jgi:hypothetical protein
MERLGFEFEPESANIGRPAGFSKRKHEQRRDGVLT